MPRRKNSNRKVRIMPLDQIVQHLQEEGFLVFQPFEGEEGWEMYVQHGQAPAGTPPISIPLDQYADGGLWADQVYIDSLVRSDASEKRRRPGRLAPRARLQDLRPLPRFYSWIQAVGCQGHYGADPSSGDEWIRVTRCTPDHSGGVVCQVMGDVPIQYLPDGTPGVRARELEELIGPEPEWLIASGVETSG